MVVQARVDLLTSLAALVFHDATDGAFSNTVFASKGSIGDSARRMPLANLLDLRGAEFRARMLLGSADVLWLGHPTGAPAPKLVMGVGKLGTEVQMVRIDTPAVLPAGTAVKHPQIARHWPAMKQPGYTGHADGFAVEFKVWAAGVVVAITANCPATLLVDITNEMPPEPFTQRGCTVSSRTGSSAEPAVVGGSAISSREERRAALLTNRRRCATNFGRLFGHRSSLLRCHGTGRPARRCRPSIVPGMRQWL